jgi:hypothetical protein
MTAFLDKSTHSKDQYPIRTIPRVAISDRDYWGASRALVFPCHNTVGGAYCGYRYQRSLKVRGINIYVGNVPFKTGDDDLRDLFEQFGRVETAKVIMDRASGRSKGFGFVEMADREEGLRAIEELDSKDFMGRSLRVNEAKPRKGQF